MNVQLKVLPNQDVELWQGDQKVKTFETTQDPGLGLKLLLKVDSLKDKEGRAIYENYKSGSHFLWGLHQEEMLHAYCRAFVAYRSVLVYLEENQLRVVSCSDTTASGLSTLISLWLPHLKSNSLKKIFGRYLRDLVWLLICLSAVISGRLRRVKVGLFSYDQIWQGHTFDRRLKDIYALLERKKIGFLEIFPGFAVLSLKHFLKRKRLALYYPAVLNEKCLHIEYDFSGWSALEAKFVKKLVRLFEEKIDRDQKIVQSLKRFLKSSGLRKIYSIDDAWDTTPLVVAAAECEIELIGIQHGYLDRYHQGWLQEGLPQEFALGFPELWVWGESTKKVLSDKSHAYRDDQLIVSGYSRVLSQKRRAQLKAQGENFTVLYPYEFLAEFKQVAQYIEAFLQKGYRVWFKARWDDPLEEQIACLPRDKIEIHYDLTQEQLDEVDVCVGSSTSFLHEMYFLGIPIWYLETNANYQEGMVEQGFATRVTLSEVSSKDFDPAIRLQQPQNAERIYAPSRLNELFADDATGDAIA